MYNQIREDTFFIMFYAAVTATAIMASFYLLFRRANAIAPDVTPPTRLRLWTAVFLATCGLNHVWYMPILLLSSNEDIMMVDLIGGLLDFVIVFPLAIVVLLAMLQDRRRPLWPIAVMMAPLVAGEVFSIVTRSYALLPMAYVYFPLMCIGLIIYMVRALRQYGHWLRDNYADLEHKEVWQSFVVLAIVLIALVLYAFVTKGPVYQYAMQVIILVLVGYLLWRVETLSDLSIKSIDDSQIDSDDNDTSAIQTDTTEDLEENVEENVLSPTIRNNIEQLLQQHCIDTQLYLQHDLNISQLAKAIGTNRFYLSQYFSTQGTTYNAYVNGLRINHFMRLYGEAVAASRPFTAQQLASESGYRSYNTFRNAFKLRMGQNVREWMSHTAPNCQNQQK